MDGSKRFNCGEAEITVSPGYPHWTELKISDHTGSVALHFHHEALDDLEYLIKKAKQHLHAQWQKNNEPSELLP